MKKNVSAGNHQEPATALRIGEFVQVKSADEILAMLDERGRMEALPFMPEMLQFAGKQLRVYRRPSKHATLPIGPECTECMTLFTWKGSAVMAQRMAAARPGACCFGRRLGSSEWIPAKHRPTM